MGGPAVIWVLGALAGALLAFAGARVATAGVRRARAGERIALEAASIEYQLAHDPDHVIGRAKVGYRIAASGARLARRGRLLSGAGFGIAVAAVIGTYLDITT